MSQHNTRYHFAVCVPGLDRESSPIRCDGQGVNVTVDNANYTCLAGYYKTPAPTYCERMRPYQGSFYWQPCSALIHQSIEAPHVHSRGTPSPSTALVLFGPPTLQRVLRVSRTSTSARPRAMPTAPTQSQQATTLATLAITSRPRPLSARVCYSSKFSVHAGHREIQENGKAII
jgi:hypothetical protein